MIGQYTEKELADMGGIISSVEEMVNEGKIVRLVSRTVNYYRREPDGSWTNYHCRTIDRVEW